MRGRKLWIVFTLALMPAFSLWSCSGPETDAAELEPGAEAEAEAKADKAVPVETLALELGEIEATLRFSTNLEAEASVPVLSEASRRVVELLVEEGDKVQRGQLLVRLQDEQQKTAVARAQSQLDKARREYERQQELYNQSLISEQTFNDSTHEIEQLELALADARRELGYTRVEAPISGTVTRRMVKLGDFVTPNQELFQLVDFDTLVAKVYVPERELDRVRVGQPARIMTEAADGSQFEGIVDRVAPIVDPKSGTVKVTLAVPAQPGLLPGMYLQVQLVTDTHEAALLVPKRALVYDDSQVFVYRLTEGSTVERLEVWPLLEDTLQVEVATGGVGSLTEGDRIVVAGQAGLKSGAKVRPLGQASTES